MAELTVRQAEILKFIIDYKKREDMAPSFREIGDNFGLEVKPVNDHLQALKKKGYLTWKERISRSIKILKVPEE